MASTKSVRWVCPNGLHPGVLGPTRPRRDNIVRYCLPCSMKAGRLIERTAPALQKKREVQKDKTQEKAKTKAQREKEKARRQTHIQVREVDGSMGEIDVKKTIRRMMKLAVIKQYADENYFYHWRGHDGRRTRRSLPSVNVRYSQHKPYTSGHAPYGGSEFTITVANNPRREEVEFVLLHELCHLILPLGDHHGPRFRRVQTLAAREWWPGIEVRADHPGHIYYLDARIVTEAIRIQKETT